MSSHSPSPSSSPIAPTNPNEPVPDPEGETPIGFVTPSPESPNDLPAVRALILAAYPDVVPDLVAGDSVATLLASVADARAAYAAVADRVTRPHAPEGAGSPALHPPAGGGTPLPIDPDRLPASEKIRRGLRTNVAGGRGPGPSR